MRRPDCFAPAPFFLLFAPLKATDPTRATPDACYAYACERVLEVAARNARAVVVPSVVIEDMEGGGVKVSAFYD